MTVIGVNPANEGGLCSILCHPGVIGSRGGPVVLSVRYLPSPSTPQEVLSWVLEHSSRIDVVYVESSHPVSGKGVVPTLGLEGFSEILGVFTALEIRIKGVPPDEWERAVLGGRGECEAAKFVQQEYSTFGLTPDPHGVLRNGIADAVCIAHYGVMQEVKSNLHCW